MIHDWEEETAYTRVMGHMDVVSIVSDAFNIYFPILLLILTLATYFSLGSRLLSFLGFQQFLEEAGHTGELVEEGKELVAREKSRTTITNLDAIFLGFSRYRIRTDSV